MTRFISRRTFAAVDTVLIRVVRRRILPYPRRYLYLTVCSAVLFIFFLNLPSAEPLLITLNLQTAVAIIVCRDRLGLG